MEKIDEINKLKKTLEIRERFIEKLKESNEQLKARIKPFEDSYFNGLSPIEIAELARKSIRLTCENRKLQDLLQEIKDIAEQCMTKDACFECKYSDDCYIEDHEIPTYDICKLLIQKITKAEAK